MLAIITFKMEDATKNHREIFHRVFGILKTTIDKCQRDKLVGELRRVVTLLIPRRPCCIGKIKTTFRLRELCYLNREICIDDGA